MSYTSTPLAQSRRLDQYTFLNRPNPHQRRAAPRNHGYSSISARAPSQPYTSSTRSSRQPTVEEEIDPDEPALVRFARLKERDRTSGNPANPESWTVKDTSVNIATAFQQAAATSSSANRNEEMPPSVSATGGNYNHAGTRATRSNDADFAPPSSQQENLHRRTTTRTTKSSAPAGPPREPLSGGERTNGYERAKSPVEHVVEFAKKAFTPATFYMRQPSQEPQETPRATNGHDTSKSYNYSAEEREFQSAQKQQNTSTGSSGRRAKKMSEDNKAYIPWSDESEGSSTFSDDDKRKRRKSMSKKRGVGGPLNTLPVTEYSKRKKGRRSKGGRQEEGEMSTYEDTSLEQSGEFPASGPTSHYPSPGPTVRPEASPPPPPPPPPAEHRPEPPTQPKPVEVQDSGFVDTSIEAEHRQAPRQAPQDVRGPVSVPPPTQNPPSRSYVGAAVGKLVYLVGRSVGGLMHFIVWLVSSFCWLVSRILVLLLREPIRFIININFVKIAWLILLGLAIYVTFWTILETDWLVPNQLKLIQRPEHSFRAPKEPPRDMPQLTERLQTLEKLVDDLTVQNTLTRGQMRMDMGKVDEFGKVMESLEKKYKQQRAAGSDKSSATSKELKAIKEEILALQARIAEREGEPATIVVPQTDEEARAQLRALEGKLTGVEGGVKEALEMAMAAIRLEKEKEREREKEHEKERESQKGAWWTRFGSGTSNSGVTIKSADGQDISALIDKLVDIAVSKHTKDVLARPDYALHSAGAQVVPSLTSSTYTMEPAGLSGRFIGLFTGQGQGVGRPPVTALHHELHTGHCWPFPGTEGQLGVTLSYPINITDVTIDHVAKEVAFDLRSAPRDMEVFGLIEGRENFNKVKHYRAAKNERSNEANRVAGERSRPSQSEAELEEEEYPKSMPPNQYIRLASFTYDIESTNNIQTFGVPQEIQELGVDFGVVVLRVKNNWGMNDFTCLYRLRVHGEQIPGLMPASN